MSTVQLARQEGSELIERHVLGMAEMGYSGISEQWLKRRAGDLHWRLIARAMGQRDAVFTCSEGAPLYAAFCATSLQLVRPHLPHLGGEMTLAADLYRVGHGRLASLIRVTAGGDTVGRMILVSTFVGRSEPGINRSVVRRSPRALAMPPEAPLAVRRVAEMASAATRDIRNNHFKLSGMSQTQMVLPCPATDFNAARLLYFPSYSALADRGLFQAGETHTGMIASRNVVYLGNVEPGEWMEINFKKLPSGYEVFLNGQDCRPLALMRVRFDRGNDSSITA
ncbi:Pnap_2097 family protein [Agrobacterium tumefaciens]|uniref:Pnap_2097 family protein n=1 Tax=Agrobacterium tumefaciens TaxID=358 RepID=UPI000AC5C65A|nr:Pnap_2097 family protein [Agrobacterium tumefaciens]